MKILYIDAGNRLSEEYTYRYYGDLYRELKKKESVTEYQGIPKNINSLISGENYDCIIFGLGYFAQRDLTAYNEIQGLKECKVPTIAMLHKQQILLKEKLKFCKTNKIDMLFNPHITYKKFGQILNIKSSRFWFSADPNIFYDRKIEKKYDVGFCGASHGNGKIKGETADLRDRIYDKLKNKNIEIFWNRQTSPSHRISSIEEYASKINQSKIWIATTGPLLDVSPRYFEVILSKTLLFCNKMPHEYEGMFIDGVNCVMYENDLSDFEEKLNFYLTNVENRDKIIENAYNDFIENHTNEHMCKDFLKKVKLIKKGEL
tara:strand:- start:537 stop:1487 length:951 start_codon:yes stop_codon:yes gene_type:complete